MRTPHTLYSEGLTVYTSELPVCPHCTGPLCAWPYVNGPKTVQTLSGVLTIAYRPSRCADPQCVGHAAAWKSAHWQQVAPHGGTYGYDVIAHIGWQRQTHTQRFADIHADLTGRVQISEAQVRYLYHQHYLPLLAAQERTHLAQLTALADQQGLLLSLDGLAPQGGEPQLWVVRELQTGLTVRSGFLSQQDQATFVHFLTPIAEQGWQVRAILSDKQRGLVPAVAEVFPHVRHAFCQLHYLKNLASPLAEADEAMKVHLRQAVRAAVGQEVRQEVEAAPGVLSVTGLLPAPLAAPPAATPTTETPAAAVETPTQARDAIVIDVRRRVRYLLTLKGRPPFRLAGLEMVEQLSEVVECLETLIAHHPDPRLVALRAGLAPTLEAVVSEVTTLQQAAEWLHHLADLLDPEGQPPRSSDAVRTALWAYLEGIEPAAPALHVIWRHLCQVSLSYEVGLFHSYDVAGLPRTNNDRESELRDLKRRLLTTTGQQGLVCRMLAREGAWELIPRLASLEATVRAISTVPPDAVRQERQRLRAHRDRFRLHTRSPRQARAQLKTLAQRWLALPPPAPAE